MSAPTAARVDVFWSGAGWRWAAVAYDAQNDQVGEAVYCHHKADAVREAQYVATATGARYVTVYGKGLRRPRTVVADWWAGRSVGGAA